MKAPSSMARHGTILVIVSGICALLAALALAFLFRMRQDATESTLVVQQAQTRVMLIAGCQYILEASRLGWDFAPPRGSLGVDGVHNEGFGWIDVRTGAVGPLLQDGTTKAWTDNTRFPAPGGRAARCPMFVPRRPPFAVGLTVCYNPIPGPSDANFGKPLLLKPDPMPVLPGSAPVDPTSWAAWKAGDLRPRSDSTGLSWFRCYRHAVPNEAVFTITCGAGGTLGFRDWQEVLDEGMTDQFLDRDHFEAIKAEETRMWYDVEWSAAVCAPDYHLIDNRFGYLCEDSNHSSANYPGHRPYRGWMDNGDDNAYTSLTAKVIDNNYLMPKNSSLYSRAGFYLRSQMSMSNPVGTIRWIQRLMAAPAADKW